MRVFKFFAVLVVIVCAILVAYDFYTIKPTAQTGTVTEFVRYANPDTMKVGDYACAWPIGVTIEGHWFAWKSVALYRSGHCHHLIQKLLGGWKVWMNGESTSQGPESDADVAGHAIFFTEVVP